MHGLYYGIRIRPDHYAKQGTTFIRPVEGVGRAVRRYDQDISKLYAANADPDGISLTANLYDIV